MKLKYLSVNCEDLLQTDTYNVNHGPSPIASLLLYTPHFPPRILRPQKWSDLQEASVASVIDWIMNCTFFNIQLPGQGIRRRLEIKGNTEETISPAGEKGIDSISDERVYIVGDIIHLTP